MSEPEIAKLLERWPPTDARRIQLYAQPSPNGVKVSVMLEECGLAYDYHRIEFGEEGTRSAAFLTANANGKIPLLFDPAGPDGRPLLLAESNAILVYVADKTGRFLANDGHARHETMQWLFWQASSIGPTFGQIGFFHRFAGRAVADPLPLQTNITEARRLLGILNDRLADRPWVLGEDYSIADMSLLGWVRNLIGYYQATELVAFYEFQNVDRWLSNCLARPAVQRGIG